MINISKNNLGDLGGLYLLQFLDNFSNKLDYLNISNNKIGKQSIELLSNILSKNILKLSSLNISGNQIGDKYFSEICIGISKNTHLMRFFTNDNDLGNISSVIIGTILRYDKKIKWLDLSKNKFDDENITNIYKGIISNNTLEGLILNENNISNKSLSVIKYIKYRF